jgi:hypothetical protein
LSKTRKGEKMKAINRMLRITGFLLVSLVLRWMIWGVLYLLRPFRIFDYLFLVYPGTDEDLKGYCPVWLAKTRIFSGKPSVGGLISKGVTGARGLVLVVPNTVKEFRQRKEMCYKLRSRLEQRRNLVGAKTIALAGQLPGIMLRKHGINLDYPFVTGVDGTVFSIVSTINKVVEKESLGHKSFSIVLIGVGYTGGFVYDALQQDGYRITGIDIMPTRKGIKLPKEALPIINQADMVVVLTPRGTDFLPYIHELKAEVIIIDDTHPKLTGTNGFKLYKVAVGAEGIVFYPSLPGFQRNQIPGCAVEAIVRARYPEITNCQEFMAEANSLGFVPYMQIN